jgi:hypothetical protein
MFTDRKGHAGSAFFFMVFYTWTGNFCLALLYHFFGMIPVLVRAEASIPGFFNYTDILRSFATTYRTHGSFGNWETINDTIWQRALVAAK